MTELPRRHFLAALGLTIPTGVMELPKGAPAQEYGPGAYRTMRLSPRDAYELHLETSIRALGPSGFGVAAIMGSSNIRLILEAQALATATVVAALQGGEV